MEMKKFYITTPLYYVNDKPHIGHAYTTILADVIARYKKMFNEKVFFLTGTDEHGQKVQEAADKLNTNAKQHVDKFHKNYIELWNKLNIDYDKFIRTTDQSHQSKVKIMLQNFWDKGEIYLSEYEGLYSVSEERFITEKEYSEGNFRQVTKIKEKNYFFRMSKYQSRLIEYIKQNPNFIMPDTRKNEILGFLRKPLADLCISRPKSRLKWGIEIPFDENYVTYVWFDALLNYITAIDWNQKEKNFNYWWPADYHLIGKDIITTHAVYWITMLMAAKLPLPKHILAHGWWLMENEKISKSVGNVVNPIDLIDYFGEDALRYFLMREMTLGQDSSFSFELFKKRFNDDLANDLGNVLNRVTILIRKFCKNKVPSITNTDDTDKDMIDKIKSLHKVATRHIEKLNISQLIDDVMSVVRDVNKYLEIKQPWKTLKVDQSNYDGLNTLSISAEAIAQATKILYPVIPGKSTSILSILGLNSKDFNNFEFGFLVNNNISKHGPLFPRIEND
ncbi:MAG: methionine--tRNA ligase [Candidatus Marinimicrobia bacterium]|nr:methionine--tRNA ligase [Candidatus Neomarinimicrobiota bacterium]|tara:strand:- start:322 stop:1836 length:1515 start_codon:yes stop_codon:yes gene_type:complete